MGNRYIALPTAEEQQANLKDYQEKKAKMDELESEYRKIKSSLKCSYCGDAHYAGGYCRNCYQYIKLYGTLERKYGKRETSQDSVVQLGNSTVIERAVDKIYFELVSVIHDYDKNFDVPLNERENWIKSILEMFPSDRNKTNELRGYNMMFLRIKEGQTYETIAQSYNLTKERVRQLIYSYIKSIKQKLCGYCGKQMREDGYVHF